MITSHYFYRYCGLTIFASLAAAILFTQPAAAISVQPALIDMTTGGNQNRTISVINDGAKPLPVEIVISRMELNENGETAPEPSGDDFLVFPPQALVPPGATQNFRIQWVGDPQLRQS